MPAKHLLKLLLLCCLLLSSLLACDVFPGTTSTTTPTSSDDTNGDPLNTWIKATPGVELRYEHWKSASNDEDTVTIARFDLQHVHVSVGYQPDHPQQISDWMKQTGALAVINGGYFDNHHQATALTIADGHSAGTSYPDFGGMLSVDAQGTVSLRSLKLQPYDPYNEQIEQATQSSPMLMIGGKRTQFDANSATQRRSVVAMDQQGRMLLIVSNGISFSLDEMADLLAASDLSLQTALNLDGGASTGLYINAGNQHVADESVALLPIVIVIK